MFKPVTAIRSAKSRARSNCHDDVVLARMPQPSAAPLEAERMEQEQHYPGSAVLP